MMKKTLVTLSTIAVLSGVGTVANAGISKAATSGFTLSAGMGYIHNDISNSQATTFLGSAGKAKFGGLYTKLGLGYDFNSTFGVEGDWYHLPSVTASENSAKNDQKAIFSSANKIALLGKVMLPITDDLNFIGSGGIAYAMYHTGHSDVQINTGAKAAVKDKDYNRFTPMIQAGLEYKTSQHLGLNLNVNYTFKSGQIPSAIGADFGINYHF